MDTRSSRKTRAWMIVQRHTLKVEAGFLKLFDITFIEGQDVTVLVLVVLEVSASPSGRRDNRLREANRRGGDSGRGLLVSSCESQQVKRGSFSTHLGGIVGVMRMGWDPRTVGPRVDDSGSHCVVAQAVRLIVRLCRLL
jgi:hypothetical protein